MSWNELFFDFVTLLVTVDPICTVPLYLSVTKDLQAQARKRAAMRATLIAFVILAAVAVQMVYSAIKGQLGPG